LHAVRPVELRRRALDRDPDRRRRHGPPARAPAGRRLAGTRAPGRGRRVVRGGRGVRRAATCDPVGVTTPLWSRSAAWMARAIAAREVSSLEVIDACLGRIEAVNPRINAVVHLAADARDRARASDAVLARGEATGPLHGVPFTIKDSM